MEEITVYTARVVRTMEPALPLATAEYIAGHDLELSTYAGPEAQVARLATILFLSAARSSRATRSLQASTAAAW